MARACERCGHNNAEEAKFCLQCGAMLEQEAVESGDPLVGKILLGRYRLTGVLGEGGMGKVYLAEQKMGTATRKVAVKTLHPELSGDPQLVARFHRECETVIELHHPNTVQFFDFGDLDDKTLFIVMEYIKGEDLAHVLARGPIDAVRADKLLIQICGSLHEAHQRGIVHRDLKPENVLLTSRGGQEDFVKVLDFGIAKRSEAEDESQAKLTKQGMVLGTPPYMSPEQFSGQQLDLRSDIYSLGAMTYEMITAQLPFEARTPWEWATKHLTCQPTPLEAHPSGVNLAPRKKAAIMRALSKNRDERQQSVIEFMHEFTGLADAQQAWTMATSGGIASSPSMPGVAHSPSQSPSQPGAAAHQRGTGQQYAAGGGYSHGGSQPGAAPAAPAGHPSQPGTGPFTTPNPTPGPMPMAQTPPPVGYATGSMEQSGGGAGKVIAILVFLLFVVGGAAGGGIYWWMGRTPTASGTPPIGTTPVGTNPVGANPVGANPVANGMGPAPMVPSTPTTPTTPMVPTMVEPVPTMVEPVPTMVEAPPTMETTMRPNMQSSSMMSSMGGGPSAAEIARSRGLANEAESQLGRNDIEGAIETLRRAQRSVGRRHSSVRSAVSALGRRASNKVGILMQQGRCPQAQALYRSLRGVGAERPSRQHFSDDWCRRP